MRRYSDLLLGSRAGRLTLACLVLLAVDAVGFWISLGTCLDNPPDACPSWHVWLNGVLYYGGGLLLVLVIVGWVVAVFAPVHRGRARRD